MRLTKLIAVVAFGLLGCSDDDAVAPGTAECGNGVRVGSEQCDGVDLHDESCNSAGYTGGELACSASCTWDFAACTGTAPVCGDGAREGFERCDDNNLGGNNCVDLGYDGGTIACAADCTYDTSGCTGTGPVCGNGIAEGLEECDGADLNGDNCGDWGFDKGTLACDSTCKVVTGACAMFVCGDSEIDPGETCDGADVDGETCVSLLYADPGTVGCLPTCEDFDLTGCSAPATCHDGNLDNPEEQCDINGGVTQFEGPRNTCVELGYSDGTLACTESCAFDVSGCTL